MTDELPAGVLVHNATVYTAHQRLPDAWVAMRGGQIAELGQGHPPQMPAGARRIDAQGLIVAPGFIDLHLHGGGGADVMDATDAALLTIARTHAAGGTTSWFGSTVTAPYRETMAAIQAAARFVDQPIEGATLRGIHLEGPYLSPEQLGAHRSEYARLPESEEYDAFFSAMAGRGRLTAAPEIDGALPLGEAARRHGVHVAMGHSNADLTVIRKAMAAGYRHITHLYSCSSGLRIERGYKRLGINEAALLLDDLTVELIGDGHHVPPELIQLVMKVKGPERVCLVTDAMRAAGVGPGQYRLGDMRVIVEDGVAKLPDRSKFAGSVCTMAAAVRTAVAAGIPLEQALQMASATPASIMGMGHRWGELAPGKEAELVMLDEALQPVLTLVGGRVVFDAGRCR